MEKKINKTFTLSDSSVNCYGFRLLSSGLQLDNYQRNPIGFLMHNREGGVLVRWDNIRVEGDEVKAEPVINLSNPKGQQCADEIENGFLNGASCGRVVVLEASDDPLLKLPGQDGVTVTKWYPKEVSLVDIPGNDNALVELFDENDNAINLSDFSHNKGKQKAKSENANKLSEIVKDPCFGMSFQEIDRKGLVEALKNRNLDLYKFKYWQAFGKYPKEGTLDEKTAIALTTLSESVEIQKMRSMSFNELSKADLLKRLKELDESLYKQKVGSLS